MTARTSVDVECIVALVNTHYLPEADDMLVDGRAADWLVDWLGEVNANLGGCGDEATLGRLRDVREGLRALAAANNDQPPQADAVARARSALAARGLELDLGDHERSPRFVTPAGASLAEGGIALAATSYLNARAGKDWVRVKACAAPDCRYAYLDMSRNRSRRWCEMAYCGNRAKNRAWRERHSP